MKSLTEILQRACTERTRLLALATLVRTHGSTYRKAGARLLVDASGETTGVLSGGCLEEEIAKHGQGVIETGEPALLHFDTRRLFGCDGKLEIFVERIPPASTAGNILTAIAAHLAERRTCRVRTKFAGTDQGSTILAPDALVPEDDEHFHPHDPAANPPAAFRRRPGDRPAAGTRRAARLARPQLYSSERSA